MQNYQVNPWTGFVVHSFFDSPPQSPSLLA